MKKTIKQQILEMMVKAYPKPVHRNTFLANYLYSFRNRLSELHLNDNIHYNKELAKKSDYVFRTYDDFVAACEYLGDDCPLPREKNIAEARVENGQLKEVSIVKRKFCTASESCKMFEQVALPI